MKVSTCIVCGERFIGESQYCSEKCREENITIRKKAKEMRMAKPRKPKIKSELARINAEAREAGMSYGRYVAMAESGKH